MLFCVFHSFLRVEEQVKEERIKSMKRTIYNFSHENNYFAERTMNEVDSFAEYLVEGKEQYIEDVRLVEKELERFLEQTERQFDTKVNWDDVEAVSNRIYKYLSIEDDEIRKIILRKRLEYEFGMKVGHVNLPEKKAHVCLNVKNNNIEFSVSNDGEINIEHFVNLIKEVVYLDDPFVLDDLDTRMPVQLWNRMEHRGHLLSQIVDNGQKSEFSALDELIANQKLQKVF